MAPSLFFSTSLAYGFGAGNYWSAMIRDICAALGRAGHPCDMVEAATNIELGDFLVRAREARRPFTATFNFAVPFPEMSAGGQTIFAQELLADRAVTIFLDHPAHLARQVARFEAAARRHAHRPAPAPPPLYGVIEQGHAAVLGDLGIEPARIFVFAQAGPPPAENVPPLADRPIDLLFFGSIGDLASDDEFLRQHGLAGMGFGAVAAGAIDAALAGSEDVYRACKRGLAAIGWGNDPVRVADFARLIDLRARALRRWKLLSGLAGLDIAFCGEVAESFRRANPKGRYLGPKPFAAVLDLARRSRLVLNDTINLRHAALMRLYYAMAQGCVLASESNQGLRESFADGEEIVLLEPGAAHAERLRQILADPARAQRIADAGRARQIAAHRWDHRIGGLLAAVA